MSEYTPKIPSLKEMSHREALIIVAAVAMLLIFLVILRFGCNMCIDVCVLRDVAEARSTARDFWNYLCPFCRIREIDQDEEIQDENENEIALVDVNSLLLRLTAQEKSLLIGSVLTSKVIFGMMLLSYFILKDILKDAPTSCFPTRLILLFARAGGD